MKASVFILLTLLLLLAACVPLAPRPVESETGPRATATPVKWTDLASCNSEYSTMRFSVFWWQLPNGGNRWVRLLHDGCTGNKYLLDGDLLLSVTNSDGQEIWLNNGRKP